MTAAIYLALANLFHKIMQKLHECAEDPILQCKDRIWFPQLNFRRFFVGPSEISLALWIALDI